MDELTRDYPGFLLGDHQPPCLSLYQPTHRRHPENVQDPIRFRSLVKALEKALREDFGSSDIAALLRPFEALASDRTFWNHTDSGLAVLGSPELFRVYKLPRPVAELAVVADNFHTKPLMRIVQSADHYQILSLGRRSFAVYEGNRDALHEVPPIDGVAYTADELSGLQTDAREGAYRAHGLTGVGRAAHHGTDVKQDSDDRDLRRFFQAVDQVVMEHFSRPSGKRLILAALPQHQGVFRSISRNPLLIDSGIETNPDALSLDELRERAWELLLPHYLERLAGFVEAFGAVWGTGRGTEDLDKIAEAAMTGRIETLLVEADRIVPGTLPVAAHEAGSVRPASQEVDDVLDDISEHVLRRGGEVIIVPGERMPTRTGAAAIFRF